MAKPKKLILVTAEHHPLHKAWTRMVEALSSELGLDFEVKLEDYVFLTKYGETDDLGMTWLPQLLVELEDGSIRPLLSEMPLNDAYKADPEKAKEVVKERLKQL